MSQREPATDPEAIPWPGWDDLPAEAKTRIRLRLARSAARKAENPSLKAAAYRVLYDALIATERTISEFATERETEQRDHLLASIRHAEVSEAHHLIEQLEILERGIRLRRQLGECAQADSETRRALLEKHDRWVRRMRAVRDALNVNGLSEATFSLSEAEAFVTLRAPDSRRLRSKRSSIARSLRQRLPAEDRVRLSYASYFPVFIPADAKAR